MRKSRRQFIKSVSIASTALFPTLVLSNNAFDKILNKSLDGELVKEFVTIAHKDTDDIVKMLEKTPHLLNVTQDWGDGDFESAIGAAGHMGFKDQVNYLINKGARFDIFVLTMLGKTDIVKSLIDFYPHLLNSIGPHGFTLLHHAEKGSSDSEDLYDYIYNKGLTKNFIKTFKK